MTTRDFSSEFSQGATITSTWLNNVQAKLREVVSVEDFGAVGDGTTDDAAAINQALANVRSSIATGLTLDGTATVLVRFTPGRVYRINSSINATSLAGVNIVIDGCGAVLDARCNGAPAIDMLGSNCLTLRDLTIIGNSSSTPTYGVQMGRISSANGGKVKLNNIVMDGHFSKACLYNFAGEVNYYEKVRLTNRSATAGASCMTLDGGNYENIASAFVTQTVASGSAMSFNEQLFMSCEFRHLSNGTPIILRGDMDRHNYVNCYARSDSANQIILSDRSLRLRDLWFDMHVEVGTVAKYLVVDNVNPAANINLSGLKIIDHNPFVSTAIIDGTGTTRALLLDDCCFDLGDPNTAIPVFGATAGPTKMQASGVIKWASAKTLDISGGYFNGDIFCRDSAAITHTLGSYRVTRRPNGSTYQVQTVKGVLQVLGTAVGSSPANYWEIEGQQTGFSPTIKALGDDTNLNARIRGKGTGGVILEDGSAANKLQINTTGVGFQGTGPIAKPTVTGSRGGNAALASLLTALANYGLITNSSSS